MAWATQVKSSLPIRWATSSSASLRSRPTLVSFTIRANSSEVGDAASWETESSARSRLCPARRLLAMSCSESSSWSAKAACRREARTLSSSLAPQGPATTTTSPRTGPPIRKPTAPPPSVTSPTASTKSGSDTVMPASSRAAAPSASRPRLTSPFSTAARRRRPRRPAPTWPGPPTDRAGSAAPARAPAGGRPGRARAARPRSRPRRRRAEPATSGPAPDGGRLRGPEHPRRELDAQLVEPIGEPWPDAGGHRLAEELAGRIHAGRVVEQERVLEGDGLPLHALHLGHVGDPAGAVAQPGELDDDVDGGGNLLADGAQRQVHAGHEHQRLEAGDGVPGRVRVHRGQRAVVPGVHRLQHVQALAATALPDHDAVGPHPQRVADEVADRDRAFALDVGRPRLQPDHVLLLQLQLDGVLDGDDPLALRDEGGQHVEQRHLYG